MSKKYAVIVLIISIVDLGILIGKTLKLKKDKTEHSKSKSKQLKE